MNDDELRAFLEAATVGDDDPQPNPAPETPEPAAPLSEERQGTASDAAPLSFEEVIGGKRSEATTAPVTGTGAQQGPAAGAPAADFSAATAPLNVEPLVLPDPLPKSQVDPTLTPLHLPEPKNPYQATPPVTTGKAGGVVPAATVPMEAVSAQSPSAPQLDPIDELFAPTQQMQQAESAQAPAAGAAATAATAVNAAAARTAPAAAAPAQVTAPNFASRSGEPQQTATESKPHARSWVPWAIVGGGAAIALVASLFIVNAVRADVAPEQTTAPPVTTTESPTVAPSPTPTEQNDDEDEDSTADTGKPPTVEVGPTMTLPVTQWGITAELSSRFGQTYYNINTPDQLVLNSSLIDSLPESCAAMRQQWGITRVDATKFEVMKPAIKCAEAPELYDELWGLTAAMVKSITPQ